MKRKLWLFNILLIAAIALAAWTLRKEARELRAREDAVLKRKPPIPPPPAQPPATPPPTVAAASYLDIAQKVLFYRDRNSQVIQDPPPPPEKPKPLPPLPAVSGVMNLDGPMVMMADKPGGRQRGVRPGEQIGVFKLVSVDKDDLVLAWEDRTVKKSLQELIDRSGDPAQPAGQSGSAAQAPAPPPVVGKPEPGVKLSDDVATCQTNDPSPAGTVVNGMRKVVSATPFGQACRWEAVK